VKAFGYIRVSTRDQDEDVQRRAIEEFTRSRGIEVLRFYVDKVSGASAFRERPEGSRLVKDLEAERVDAVVVWSIDRLGRSMIDTLNTVIELEQGHQGLVGQRRSGYKLSTRTLGSHFYRSWRGSRNSRERGLGRGN